MPSSRRAKALLIALISVLLLTLFLSYHSSPSQNPYMRTLRSVTEAERQAAAGLPLLAASHPETRAEIITVMESNTIVIFSKSNCPYSKRAKALLLDKYSIEPPPFVVELDLKENGEAMQKELEALTGRGTVPNIMVSGKSIGGCDDVEKLDKEGRLADRIRLLGSDRLTQIF